ncbi:MAG: 23S rRNA (pseudouridine(1915)-N(3))-methyltransferase RlmH [candidate division Zixibacteria bacterium]|nr:23S rRNA (pseudouridine(1915)-N(3))-methyltransferase RlmH [candidate division Zixibacteria bacterium]
MIKIKLTVIGKLHNEFAKKWVEHYKKLLGKHCELEVKFVKEEKLNEGKNEVEVLRRESERIIEAVKTGDFLVILDSKGRRFRSKDFAKFIENYYTRSDVTLHFVVGGAIGVSEQILKFADMKLSLSDMTFAHQLTTVIFLEQLFRAISIVQGLPYHK